MRAPLERQKAIGRLLKVQNRNRLDNLFPRLLDVVVLLQELVRSELFKLLPGVDLRVLVLQYADGVVDEMDGGVQAG